MKKCISYNILISLDYLNHVGSIQFVRIIKGFRYMKVCLLAIDLKYYLKGPVITQIVLKRDKGFVSTTLFVKMTVGTIARQVLERDKNRKFGKNCHRT